MTIEFLTKFEEWYFGNVSVKGTHYRYSNKILENVKEVKRIRQGYKYESMQMAWNAGFELGLEMGIDAGINERKRLRIKKNEQENITSCVVCNNKFNIEDKNILDIFGSSSGLYICKDCVYKRYNRKCIKCGCLFKSPNSSGALIPCPKCEEDGDLERYGRKVTKRDIDKLFKEIDRLNLGSD